MTHLFASLNYAEISGLKLSLEQAGQWTDSRYNTIEQSETILFSLCRHLLMEGHGDGSDKIGCCGSAQPADRPGSSNDWHDRKLSALDITILFFRNHRHLSGPWEAKKTLSL